MVSDGGYVVTGIALTSDIKVATNEFRVLLEEASEQIRKILCNLVFVADIEYTAVRKARSDRLVNVK